MKMYAYALGDSRETSVPKSRTLYYKVSVFTQLRMTSRNMYLRARLRYIAAEKKAGAIVRQHIWIRNLGTSKLSANKGTFVVR